MLKDKMFVINNGIILDKFINKPVKIPNRFIYTSCSERGLERLLKLWPKIIEKIIYHSVNGGAKKTRRRLNRSYNLLRKTKHNIKTKHNRIYRKRKTMRQTKKR